MKPHPAAGRRRGRRMLASALLGWALPAAAADPCAGAGVQLLRQQLMPASPAYYLACGVPAASARSRRLAVGDRGDAIGPSDCDTQLCMFDASTGRRLSRSSLTDAPAGVELGEHLRPLIEALRDGSFQPMKPMTAQLRPGGATFSEGDTRVDFEVQAATAWVVARRSGYEAARHRFKPRTMRCPPEPNRQALPQDLRAWSMDGVAALVLAAEYKGAEPGCSWTEWVVVPLKATARRPGAASGTS